MLLFMQLIEFQLSVSFRLQQVTQIDADLKVKSQAYNSLKGNLQNLERKATYVSLFLLRLNYCRRFC